MIKKSTRRLLALVLMSTPALSVASEVLIAGSERLEEGKEAYEEICARCHESGTDGAPITGSEQDWDDRSSLWEAVLFEHAEKGYINMPARGASEDATAYDVEAAAEYMLTITHPELQRD